MEGSTSFGLSLPLEAIVKLPLAQQSKLLTLQAQRIELAAWEVSALHQLCNERQMTSKGLALLQKFASLTDELSHLLQEMLSQLLILHQITATVNTPPGGTTIPVEGTVGSPTFSISGGVAQNTNLVETLILITFLLLRFYSVLSQWRQLQWTPRPIFVRPQTALDTSNLWSQLFTSCLSPLNDPSVQGESVHTLDCQSERTGVNGSYPNALPINEFVQHILYSLVDCLSSLVLSRPRELRRVPLEVFALLFQPVSTFEGVAELHARLSIGAMSVFGSLYSNSIYSPITGIMSPGGGTHNDSTNKDGVHLMNASVLMTQELWAMEELICEHYFDEHNATSLHHSMDERASSQQLRPTLYLPYPIAASEAPAAIWFVRMNGRYAEHVEHLRALAGELLVSCPRVRVSDRLIAFAMSVRDNNSVIMEWYTSRESEEKINVQLTPGYPTYFAISEPKEVIRRFSRGALNSEVLMDGGLPPALINPNALCTDSFDNNAVLTNLFSPDVTPISQDKVFSLSINRRLFRSPSPPLRSIRSNATTEASPEYFPYRETSSRTPMRARCISADNTTNLSSSRRRISEPIPIRRRSHSYASSNKSSPSMTSHRSNIWTVAAQSRLTENLLFSLSQSFHQIECDAEVKGYTIAECSARKIAVWFSLLTPQRRLRRRLENCEFIGEVIDGIVDVAIDCAQLRRHRHRRMLRQGAAVRIQRAYRAWKQSAAMARQVVHLATVRSNSRRYLDTWARVTLGAIRVFRYVRYVLRKVIRRRSIRAVGKGNRQWVLFRGSYVTMAHRVIARYIEAVTLYHKFHSPQVQKALQLLHAGRLPLPHVGRKSGIGRVNRLSGSTTASSQQNDSPQLSYRGRLDSADLANSTRSVSPSDRRLSAATFPITSVEPSPDVVDSVPEQSINVDSQVAHEVVKMETAVLIIQRFRRRYQEREKFQKLKHESHLINRVKRFLLNCIFRLRFRRQIRRATATVVIQKWYRGTRMRTLLLRTIRAGITLKAVWRQYVANKRLKSLLRRVERPYCITIHGVSQLALSCFSGQSLQMKVSVWWNPLLHIIGRTDISQFLATRQPQFIFRGALHRSPTPGQLSSYSPTSAVSSSDQQSAKYLLRKVEDNTNPDEKESPRSVRDSQGRTPLIRTDDMARNALAPLLEADLEDSSEGPYFSGNSRSRIADTNIESIPTGENSPMMSTPLSSRHSSSVSSPRSVESSTINTTKLPDNNTDEPRLEIDTSVMTPTTATPSSTGLFSNRRFTASNLRTWISQISDSRSDSNRIDQNGKVIVPFDDEVIRIPGCHGNSLLKFELFDAGSSTPIAELVFNFRIHGGLMYWGDNYSLPMNLLTPSVVSQPSVTGGRYSPPPTALPPPLLSFRVKSGDPMRSRCSWVRLIVKGRGPFRHILHGSLRLVYSLFDQWIRLYMSLDGETLYFFENKYNTEPLHTVSIAHIKTVVFDSTGGGLSLKNTQRNVVEDLTNLILYTTSGDQIYLRFADSQSRIAWWEMIRSAAQQIHHHSVGSAGIADGHWYSNSRSTSDIHSVSFNVSGDNGILSRLPIFNRFVR